MSASGYDTYQSQTIEKLRAFQESGTAESDMLREPGSEHAEIRKQNPFLLQCLSSTLWRVW